MNKKDLSERDICSKYIGPAVKRAGWDGMMQIREEVAFTKGRIIVRGKLVTRGKAKRADYSSRDAKTHYFELLNAVLLIVLSLILGAC